MKKSKNRVLGRQGDVLILRGGSITSAHVEVARESDGRIVIADGETSLHQHVMRGEGVALLRAEGVSDRVLTVAREMCELITEGGERGPGLMRHPPIVLPRGTYTIRLQREWAGEEVRNVCD
jgi:hypothetical protein